MAAALCAEGKSLPPLELEYAWQSGHGSMLPNNGGLRNQPYALIRRMNACYNTWQAMTEYLANNMDTKWVNKNPDKWKLIVGVLELYSLMDQGEIETPTRAIKDIVDLWSSVKQINSQLRE